MTRPYSPAEAAVFYHMGKKLIDLLDPTNCVLDVGTTASKTRVRRHIVQGTHALCGEHVRITRTGLRGPHMATNAADWSGVPDCQRCLTIADFIVTTRTLVIASPAYVSPA